MYKHLTLHDQDAFLGGHKDVHSRKIPLYYSPSFDSINTKSWLLALIAQFDPSFYCNPHDNLTHSQLGPFNISKPTTNFKVYLCMSCMHLSCNLWRTKISIATQLSSEPYISSLALLYHYQWKVSRAALHEEVRPVLIQCVSRLSHHTVISSTDKSSTWVLLEAWFNLSMDS